MTNINPTTEEVTMAELTQAGEAAMIEFFDEAYGAGEWRRDPARLELLDHIEARLAGGESLTYEVADASGAIHYMTIEPGHYRLVTA